MPLEKQDQQHLNREILNMSKPKAAYPEFKNYQIEELLGQGGMGKVYLAKDLRLNRAVAIKILHRPPPTNDEFDENNSTLYEAKMLARVNHPNIVQIFDILHENNKIVLVMEYIKGKTLQNIQNESLPSLLQKLTWLHQIIQGLEITHKTGIIHCDIKPSNIIVGEDNVAKITDFGVAKLSDEGLSRSTRYASQRYLSPEQANNEPIDHRSDLFSFGILAYTLITGQHPFQSKKNPFEQTIDSFEILPEIPKPLATLLNQLLKTNIGERPRNTHTVAYQLKKLTVEITQQAIFEQDTIPISNTAPKMNRVEHGNKRKLLRFIKFGTNRYFRARVMLFSISVILLIAIYANKNIPTQTKTLQIVVLRPNISGGEQISNIQKNLMLATIDSAIRNSVITSKNMRLISRKEVERLPTDIQLIGNATGATEIISPQVDCNNLQCNVTLSRLNGKQWSVNSQMQWPIIFKSFNEIYATSQLNFALLFPELNNAFLTESRSTSHDFEEYIGLYSSIRFSNYEPQQVIADLESLLFRAPYFFSAYSLFREVSLDQYSQTRNKAFLKKLDHILTLAPKEYKSTSHYLIDIFWLSINEKEFIQAQQIIAQLESFGVDNSTLSELKARLFLSENKLEKAVEYYKRAIALRPSTVLLYNLSLCYWWYGDIESSEATALKLLDIIPQDYLTQQLLASLSLFKGDIESAANIYRDIIKIRPSSIDLNNLAIAYSLGGNNQQALKSSQKAVELAPSNPTWLLNLADIESILNYKELSHRHYREVIKQLSPRNDLKSWLERAQAFAHLGEKASAIKSLNSALKISATNTEVTFTAALVHTLLKEETSAIIYVERSLENHIGAVWFNLPWFDTLCNNENFVIAISNSGNSNRCKI